MHLWTKVLVATVLTLCVGLLLLYGSIAIGEHLGKVVTGHG